MIEFALLAALLGQPPSESAPPAPVESTVAVDPETTALSTAAEAAFAEQRYESAATLYAELYAREPDPGHLYNRAQALRRAGNDKAAAREYERFLHEAAKLPPSSDPEVQNQVELMLLNAKVMLAEAQTRLAQAEEETSAPTPDPEVLNPPPASVARPTNTAPAQPPERDPATISLLAVGATLAVGGASMFIAADAVDRRANERTTHGEFETAIDRAALVQKIAPAPLAVGCALVVGGFVRYALLRKRGRTQRIEAHAFGGRHGLAGKLQLRF